MWETSASAAAEDTHLGCLSGSFTALLLQPHQTENSLALWVLVSYGPGGTGVAPIPLCLVTSLFVGFVLEFSSVLLEHKLLEGRDSFFVSFFGSSMGLCWMY